MWALAAGAMMVMLCEGAANDWSALHLKDVLGAPASMAANPTAIESSKGSVAALIPAAERIRWPSAICPVSWAITPVIWLGVSSAIRMPVLRNMFWPSATKALIEGSLTILRWTDSGLRPATKRMGSR